MERFLFLRLDKSNSYRRYTILILLYLIIQIAAGVISAGLSGK